MDASVGKFGMRMLTAVAKKKKEEQGRTRKKKKKKKKERKKREKRRGQFFCHELNRGEEGREND